MMISEFHLAPEDLVDIAEGARAEASAPHLGMCESCRQQLADVRASMAILQDVDIPEPSPLFWTQFTQRVSDAIAAEPAARRNWFAALRPRVVFPAAAAAFAIALLAVMLKPSGSPPAPTPGAGAASRGQDAAVADVSNVDSDSSLDLVADLTAGMDLVDAIDAGFTSRDSAEHAVTHMSGEELAALRQLL